MISPFAFYIFTDTFDCKKQAMKNYVYHVLSTKCPRINHAISQNGLGKTHALCSKKSAPPATDPLAMTKTRKLYPVRFLGVFPDNISLFFPRKV
jgi:hypothetical protein